MNLRKIIKQVGRVLASLLFSLLVACSSAPAAPTQLPTAQIAAQPTQPPATATSTAEPTRLPAATEPFTYTVQDGDTLSSIAAQVGLQPQTVLWANYDQLLDNPDFLLPNLQLLILPTDGLYHQVGGGDSVDAIAAFFATDAQAIIDWPGNAIDPVNPVIFAGQWLVIPGGQRFSRRPFLPNISSSNMVAAATGYGNGGCPRNAAQTLIGDGDYAWPVSAHELRGEGYWSEHPGADLAVDLDEPVLAADDGVVVFSGWTYENYGYGYAVMLDHGNGDYSLYADLAEVSVNCGVAVQQGEPLGLGGAIGHPAGSFVHFEIRRGEEWLNPLDLLP